VHARRVAVLTFVATLLFGYGFEEVTAHAAASPSAPAAASSAVPTATTTTTTTIPTLPTRGTTPTKVYGVIPNALWISCGRAWLWVNRPGLEKPISISSFEQRIVKDRLSPSFVDVGTTLERAFFIDEVHPPGVIYSIVHRSPAYPKMVRAWTNVARACRALVDRVAATGRP
jgi:hypothetical protein